ncbi:MAG TPA: DnaJ domain-containing protein [Caulobacteraceae bacterium]|nr:DnaJ domain-containing protein [Caulobacteraceae bacterium]
MILLALGLAVLALLVWAGRTKARRSQLQFAAAALGVAAFAASAWAAVRGQWVGSAILFSLTLLMGDAARPARLRASPAPPPEAISESEARSVLGVGPAASREDIQRAYHRLMLRAHPDQGGTEGLAARLNAARDRLLR